MKGQNFCCTVFPEDCRAVETFSALYGVWQYGLWSFQTGGTKLERFLPKNQHTQRKLLNFENWTSGEPQYLAKIRVFKVDYFDFSCKKIE